MGLQMIDDDSIGYASPCDVDPAMVKELEDVNWQVINCRYARLCSVIVKTLYARRAVARSRVETMAVISRLQHMLDAWKMTIPVKYRPGPPTSSRSSHFHGWNDQIQVDLTLKYSEAAFAIHRWAVLLPSPTLGSERCLDTAKSGEYCIEAAKDVLSLAQILDLDPSHFSW